ncbi:hypothetical protein BC629DRAFT_1443365 [Irpex lacteus]|nr:hypothetical protein BC629DRAFT_1443365 [Irpex lacteus]
MSNSNIANPTTLQHRRVAQLQVSMSTLNRISSSSYITPIHTKSFIDPLVRNDMKLFTKTVTVDRWVEVVCGVKPDKLNTWADYFRQKGLFTDQAISEELDTFNCALREEERYKPTAKIFEKVLEVAQVSVNELKDVGEPLLSDLRFHPHDARLMLSPEDQAALAARRKPDVLVLRSEAKKTAETKADGKKGDRISLRNRDLPLAGLANHKSFAWFKKFTTSTSGISKGATSLWGDVQGKQAADAINASASGRGAGEKDIVEAMSSSPADRLSSDSTKLLDGIVATDSMVGDGALGRKKLLIRLQPAAAF